MTLTTTIAGMVTFGGTVSGSQGSYDLTGFANAKAAGTLAYPCFVVMPVFENVASYETLTFGGQAPVVTDALDHVAIYDAVANTADFTYLMATAISLTDAYYAAMKATPFYTASSAPSNQRGPSLTRQYRQITILSVAYHAVIFRHQIMFYI